MSGNILLAIFIIQSYITRHTKKLTNLAYNQKRNSSTERDLDMTQMTELPDKHFKKAVLNMLKYFKEC